MSPYPLDCKHPPFNVDIIQRSDGISNQSTLTPAPFSSATKDLDLGVELSFRPSVIFVAAIGGLPVTVQVAVTLDMPKLDATITQVHNVNVSCDPAPPSLPSGQVYENLTLVVPTIGVDALEVFQEALNLVLVKPSDTQPFFEGSESNLPTACYAFSKVEKTLVAAAQSKPSDTSSATTNHFPLLALLLAAMLGIFTVI